MKIEACVGTAALKAMEQLNGAGFEAWAVGGCVRDALLGRLCHDVDITTSARPEEIKEVFRNQRLIETGIAHGTVTVLMEGQPLEITTYRLDGAYEDHRRPDQVTFTCRLEEDLARRDFTVNAMAWNPRFGLRDPFGGGEDLKAGILRCVGDPRQRFLEDALRILRALRFSAVYGFQLQEDTAAAIREEAGWLRCVSAERIWVELKKTLVSSGLVDGMREYGDVWKKALTAFPEVTEQQLMWMKALQCDHGEELALLRLALLLNGDMEATEKLARQAKVSRTEEAVLETAARLWNQEIPVQDGQLKRCIYREGYDAVLRWLRLKEARSADLHGKTEAVRCKEALRKVKVWHQDGECVALTQLDLDGRALIERGASPGPEIGKLLERALFGVMDGVVENRRGALLDFLLDEAVTER